MNTRFRAAATGCVTIVLSSATLAQEPETDEHHTIDEIVVTATPLERTVEQLAQPTSVLSGEALVRNQTASIGEVVVDQPGVTASYFGPVASRPVIRGQFGERVLVLSNGLASLDASALSEDHAVSLDSILADSVEVVRGPATLLYGSGAAGGIVNVVDSRIRQTPLDEPFGGAIALATESALGLESGAARFDFGSDTIAAHVDYFRRSTDDVEIPGFAESEILHESEGHDDHDEDEDHDHEEEEHEEEEETFGYIENTDSRTEGGSAAISLTGDNSNVGFSVSRYTSQYGVPGEHHHHHEEEEHEGEEDHEDEEEHEEHEEEGESVRIDLDQTRYDLAGEVGFDGFLDSVKFRLVRNDYTHTELEGDEIGTVFDSRGFDSRFEFRQRAGERLEGAFGVQYKSIDFSAAGEEAFVPASDTAQFSLFTFQEYSFTESFVLQGSARVEHQDLTSSGLPSYDEMAFGASIGSIWSFADGLQLAANLALTERHPNSTELYANGPHLAAQRFEIGSVEQGLGLLDKEVSTNLDLTLRGAFGRFQFSLTGFINRVDDYILLNPTDREEDELQVFEYGQTDVDMYGFEAEAIVDLIESEAGHLHVRFASDFVFAEERSSGNYLPRIPPMRFGGSLHYTKGAFEASAEAVWHDEQDKLAPNELPTDGYTLVGAELSYSMMDSLFIFAKGTNLTDEEARRHVSPLKDLAPLPGRSLHLGLRWDF